MRTKPVPVSLTQSEVDEMQPQSKSSGDENQTSSLEVSSSFGQTSSEGSGLNSPINNEKTSKSRRRDSTSSDSNEFNKNDSQDQGSTGYQSDQDTNSQMSGKGKQSDDDEFVNKRSILGALDLSNKPVPGSTIIELNNHEMKKIAYIDDENNREDEEIADEIDGEDEEEDEDEDEEEEEEESTFDSKTVKDTRLLELERRSIHEQPLNMSTRCNFGPNNSISAVGGHSLSAESFSAMQTSLQHQAGFPPYVFGNNAHNQTPLPMHLPRSSMIFSSSTNSSMSESLSGFAMAEQNMVCMVCAKSFRFEKNLLRHMQKAHSTGEGESVLKCKLCNYTTKHYSNMYVHIRTHTGDKPYWCSACGAAFTQGSSLKLHIKSRHNDNTSFFSLTKKPGKNNLTKLWTRVLKKDLPKFNAVSANNMGFYSGGHFPSNPGHPSGPYPINFRMMDQNNPPGSFLNYYQNLSNFPSGLSHQSTISGSFPPMNLNHRSGSSNFMENNGIPHMVLPPSLTPISMDTISSMTNSELMKSGEFLASNLLKRHARPSSPENGENECKKASLSPSTSSLDSKTSNSQDSNNNANSSSANDKTESLQSSSHKSSMKESQFSRDEALSTSDSSQKGFSDSAMSFNSHFHKIEELSESANKKSNTDVTQQNPISNKEMRDNVIQNWEVLNKEKSSTNSYIKTDSSDQSEKEDVQLSRQSQDGSKIKELSKKLRQLRETASAFIMQLCLKNPHVMVDFQDHSISELLRQLGHSIPIPYSFAHFSPDERNKSKNFDDQYICKKESKSESEQEIKKADTEKPNKEFQRIEDVKNNSNNKVHYNPASITKIGNQPSIPPWNMNDNNSSNELPSFLPHLQFLGYTSPFNKTPYQLPSFPIQLPQTPKPQFVQTQSPYQIPPSGSVLNPNQTSTDSPQHGNFSMGHSTPYLLNSTLKS